MACERVLSEQLIAYRSRPINSARRCERSVESSESSSPAACRADGGAARAMSLPAAATDQLRSTMRRCRYSRPVTDDDRRVSAPYGARCKTFVLLRRRRNFIDFLATLSPPSHSHPPIGLPDPVCSGRPPARRVHRAADVCRPCLLSFTGSICCSSRRHRRCTHIDYLFLSLINTNGMGRSRQRGDDGQEERDMRLLRLRAIMCKLVFDDDRHPTSRCAEAGPVGIAVLLVFQSDCRCAMIN